MLIDKKYDLCIAMTWPPVGMNHGMCGHIFEVVDYYLLLKQKYKCCILIAEDMDIEYFISTVKSKYNITAKEIDELHNDIILANRPTVVMGRNILFVDGLLKHHLQEYGVKLIFKNIFTFRCSYKSTHHDLLYKNVRLLQDKRVYDDLDNDMAIDYVKKIYFAKYNTIQCDCSNVAMLYVTNNCRYMSIEQIDNLVSQYNFERYIILTDIQDIITHYETSPIVKATPMPVDELFKKFNTYIYTPTTTRFDCSPRFIAECKFYNKQVIYHDIDDDYLKDDTGLKYRRDDIEDINKVTLTSNDDIFNILNNYINDR